MLLFLKRTVEQEGKRNQSADRSSTTIDLEDGRDELNLAEFPLAAIADRVPDDQKTLVFEDRIWDSGKAETITRRLTISASDKFGLPTSLDDEVILGLIQFTKQNRFTDRHVSFSRYQLIQILGWRHEGKSYDRLEKSLKRWLGVTLYYDKAWWDKDEQSWVDENFHILEQVTLYDQERRLRKLRSGQHDLPLSSFTWNEVVFRSFKSGYLKSLDLNLYRQLEHATAKRMYRFLDKRFYHKPHWEFELAEFACEHIGLSRNYDTAQLKRRLQPAIEELETVGFLVPLPIEQRYVRISRGQWRIVLTRHTVRTPVPECTGPQRSLVEQLTARGVTESVAEQLVRCYSADTIEEQVIHFDRRLTTDPGSIRNPAGYLVKAIRENFAVSRHRARTGATHRSERTIGKKTRTNPRRDPADEKLKSYLQSLTSDKVKELEAAALARASSLLRDGYRRSAQKGGAAHEAYRQVMLEQEARRILGEQGIDLSGEERVQAVNVANS